MNVGNAVDLTPVSNGSYCFCVISCNRGDQFTLTAKGGNNSRAWAFIDSDNNLLSKADANVTVTNLKLIAPAVGSLIVNAYVYNDYLLTQTISKIDNLSEKTDILSSQLVGCTDATSDVTKGAYIDTSVGAGNIVDIANSVTNTNFGYVIYPCYVGDEIILSCHSGQAPRAWAILDNNKKILSVAAGGVMVTDLTITATQTGYFVINVNLAFDYSIKHKFVAVNERLDTIENSLEKVNETDYVLPSTLYGVVGHEFNLYKDNALIYGNIDSVADVKFGATTAAFTDIIENKKRYSATPINAWDNYPQFSLYRQTVKTRDKFKNLHVIVKDPSVLNGLTRNIVIIGDSKVTGGRLPQVFKNLCTESGMTVGDLCGSIRTTSMSVNHEGRAGWTSSDYFTASKAGVSNAFYNNGTFDFSYWMNQQGYTHMDYVYINLGTNDYAVASGLGSDDYIQTFINNISAMITSIHAYDTNIKIIIGLAEGVCTSQWSSSNDEYLYNLNTRARMLNRACITEWDSEYYRNNNIWICPIYLSMDMENDYVMNEIALSEWDSYFNTGKTRNMVTDRMHQNAVGYAKNAMYMFAILCYIESLS